MAHSRIDDLRRRVEADPASIAFAQLAEEYRRAGQTEEAVRVSREGLTRHPGYLSARVTLGRALLDLGQLDEARIELQFVASEAPENLAAVRGLAEIFHREGDAASALEYFQRALSLARHDPELEEIVQQLSRQVGAESGPSTGLTFEEAHQELLSAADRMPLAPASAAAETEADAGADPGSTAPFNFDTLVAALGTPAAPPLVEAVVAGETPPVFELPDMPAVDTDPFAALEAELRAQDDEPEPSVAEQVAALAEEEPIAAHETTEPAPLDQVMETVVEAEADQVFVLEAEVETLFASSESGGDDEATLEWPPPLPAETDPQVESPSEPYVEASAALPWPPASPPSVEALGPIELPDWVEPSPPTVVEALASEVPEAAGFETAPQGSDPAEMPTPMEATMAADETAEDTVAPAPVSQTSEPQPAAPPKDSSDEVLGDLEDWLNTLQDRSSQ